MANMGSYKGVEIPVGTSKAEIQKIIERVDAGSSGELMGGNKATPADVVNPSDATDRIGMFGAALNKAVDEARKNRKDATLDFMNGVVPPGALPASSFSKVLQAFNSDSAPLESTLLSSAMDFAKEQEKILEDRKNSIRDLALAVGKNGGSQETVNAIAALVESGDIDAALKVGATSLQELEQVGNSLVKRNADGTVEVVYTAPSTTGGGGSNASWTNTQKLKLEAEFGADWAGTTTREEQVQFLAGTGDALLEDPSFPLPEGVSGPIVELSSVDFFEADQPTIDREMSRLLGASAPKIKKLLTAELQKDFMNDWIYMQEAGSKPIDPWLYFESTWAPAAGVSTTEKKDTKKEDDTRNPLGN